MPRILILLLALFFSLSSPTMEANVKISHSTLAANGISFTPSVYQLGEPPSAQIMLLGLSFIMPEALLANAQRTAAAESGAYNTIGSTGKIGEQWLAENLGGESQAYFSTSQGARYVDQFAGGIANESKVGYTSLTPSIQLQISKDAELLNIGRVQGVNWHFFQSPVTGLGGSSQPLLNALQQNGINAIIH